MAETIILEVDANSLVKSLADGQRELDKLKTAYKDIIQVSGEFSVEAVRAKAAIDAQAKSNLQQKNALTTVTLAQKELSAATVENIKNYSANLNSIDENRKAYNALFAVQKSMKDASPALQAQIKSLSDTIKQQEGVLGYTGRNVGNYRDEFKTALGSITAGIPGLEGFKTAQLGVNAAMSANPAGAVVLALTSLFQIMSQNKEVADQVAFVFAGLNKAFGVFVDFTVEAFKSLSFLKDITTDFSGTMSKLGDIIYDNVLNRFKALGGYIDAISLALEGKFSEAANKAFDSAIQMATGSDKMGKSLRDGAAEGYASARSLDALTVESGKLDIAIQKNQRNIDALTKSLKDRTKSEQERIDIANEIANLEIKNADIVAARSQKALEIEQQRTKGRVLSGEEENKLNQAKFAVEDALAAKKEVIAQRETRINILLDKQNKDLAKGAVETEQEKLDKIAALNAAREKTYIEAKQAGIERDLELQALAFEKQKEQLIDAGVSMARIEEINLEQISKIKEDYRQKEIDQSKTDQEEVLAMMEEDLNASIEVDRVKAEQAAYYAEERKNTEAEVYKAAEGIANAFSSLGTLIGEQTAAGIAFQKVAAGIQIAIDAAKAIGAAIAGAAAAAATTSAAAPFTLVAYIASGIAAVTTAIVSAKNLIAGAGELPAPPKFAEGGEVYDIGGRPHSQGGTLFRGSDGTRFEAERGEKLFVLKANASKYIDTLGGINMLFGGRSWTDSPVSYAASGGMITDGGYTMRNTTDQVSAQLAIQQLGTMLQNMPAPLVSVIEIDKVKNSRQRGVSVSEL